MDKLAVFCGANTGHSAIYAEQATELADALCAQGITLVYGGAKIGLMGIIANRMLKQGGQVIGVIPQSLVDVEIAHDGLTALHVVESMQERKQRLFDLADGFIMLPGGFGSMDEFFEILTLRQLGHHQKPCGILNTAGYYDALLRFLDHASAQGFLKRIYRQAIFVAQAPTALLEKLTAFDLMLT